MTNKHTPGPWLKDEHHRNGEFQIAGAGTSHAGVHSWHEDEAEEGEANARLIAAAPELLEALQAMVAAYRPADDDDLLEFEPWTKAARAAIAKATGDQQ